MTKKMVRNRPIRQVAHHEAAHAVIAYLLDCTLGPVSIVAKGQTKGRCEQARPRGVMAPTLVLDGAALRPMTDGERREWARRELDRRHATILAAGVSAEEKSAGGMPRPIYYFAGTNVLDDCFVESDVDEIMTIGGTVSRTPAGVLAYLDRARRSIVERKAVTGD